MSHFADLLLALPALVLAVTLHEMAHGWVARLLGDRTAEHMGRLSLNPLRHIDPVGSVLIPAALLIGQAPLIFGYAKPVPVNFEGLKYGPLGTIAVALAGPLTNFILAFMAVVGWVALSCPGESGTLATLARTFCLEAAMINMVLGVFNLIPFPPLDGSRVVTAFFPRSWAPDLARFERIGVFALLALLILSSSATVTAYIPLPPLMDWVRQGVQFGLGLLQSSAEFVLSGLGISC